jgi:hypothetical protein
MKFGFHKAQFIPIPHFTGFRSHLFVPAGNRASWQESGSAVTEQRSNGFEVLEPYACDTARAGVG